MPIMYLYRYNMAIKKTLQRQAFSNSVTLSSYTRSLMPQRPSVVAHFGCGFAALRNVQADASAASPGHAGQHKINRSLHILRERLELLGKRRGPEGKTLTADFVDQTPGGSQLGIGQLRGIECS